MSLFGQINGFHGQYRFLSNFWPSRVQLEDGDVYPTVEHAYQAAKTLDPFQRSRICDYATPGQAKRAGKLVTKRYDWEAVKIPIMMDLNRQKYANDETLRLLLYQTGDMLIEETNTWGDVFWGVCDGEGRNELGKILMLIRQEIDFGDI